MFPDESHRSNDSSTHSNTQSTDSLTGKQKTPDHGWQIIVPVPQRSAGEPDGDEAAGDADRFEPERTAQPSVESVPDDMSAIPSTSGILPAAARRLISLKDLGARKFGALKMKLIENNAKANERGEPVLLPRTHNRQCAANYSNYSKCGKLSHFSHRS